MPDESATVEILARMNGDRKVKTTRTTFSFSESGLKALSWLAARRDPPTHRKAFEGTAFFAALFAKQADQADTRANILEGLPAVGGGDRMRRTFVIDQADLRALSLFAKKADMARDEATERLLIAPFG